MEIHFWERMEDQRDAVPSTQRSVEGDSGVILVQIWTLLYAVLGVSFCFCFVSWGRTLRLGVWQQGKRTYMAVFSHCVALSFFKALLPLSLYKLMHIIDAEYAQYRLATASMYPKWSVWKVRLFRLSFSTFFIFFCIFLGQLWTRFRKETTLFIATALKMKNV